MRRPWTPRPPGIRCGSRGGGRALVVLFIAHAALLSVMLRDLVTSERTEHVRPSSRRWQRGRPMPVWQAGGQVGVLLRHVAVR